MARTEVYKIWKSPRAQLVFLHLLLFVAWFGLEPYFSADDKASMMVVLERSFSEMASGMTCGKTGLAPLANQSQKIVRTPLKPDASCQLPVGAKWIIAKSTSAPRRSFFWQAVYESNDIVSASMERYGFWEVDSPESLGIMSPGTFVDVGANLGAWTFAFANAGHCVIAIEPLAGNLQLINATLCANPQFRQRVKVIPALLGDKEDVGQKCGLYTSADNIGDAIVDCRWLIPAYRWEADNRFHFYRHHGDVPIKTLQQIYSEERIKDVHVFKMDVEGSECSVLRGAPFLAHRYSITYARIETSFPGTYDCVKVFGLQGKFQMSSKGADTILRRGRNR